MSTIKDIQANLYAAILANDREHVRRMLAQGIDANMLIGPHNTPALHLAAFHDATGDIVNDFLRYGANPHLLGRYDTSVVHQAVTNMHVNAAALEQLLAAGAPADLPDDEGETPLHKAISKGHNQRRATRLITLLVKAGANPDTADNWGVTPRQIATEMNYTYILDIFDTCR